MEIKKTRAPSIVILGSYGTTNIGDQAILTAMIKLINTYCPGNNITVIGPNPDRISLYHGVHALSSYRAKDFISKITLFRSSKVLIIGGGGLLQDNRRNTWFRGMIPSYVSQALLAKLCGCRLALIGVSIGPLFSLTSRLLVSFLCKACDIIITRDRESMDIALELGSNPLKTNWAPDLTFCLVQDDDNSQQIPSLSNWKKSEDYCVLSLRSLYGRKDKNRPFGFPIESINSFSKFLTWVIERVGLNILFVPFDSKRDILVGKYFAQLLGNPMKFQVVSENLSINEIIQLLASAKVTIGMRLHSLILSYAAGTPVIPIIYDTKVANFARQIGATRVLIPQAITAKSVQRIFLKTLKSGPNSDNKKRLESSQRNIHLAFKQLSRCVCTPSIKRK